MGGLTLVHKWGWTNESFTPNVITLWDGIKWLVQLSYWARVICNEAHQPSNPTKAWSFHSTLSFLLPSSPFSTTFPNPWDVSRILHTLPIKSFYCNISEASFLIHYTNKNLIESVPCFLFSLLKQSIMAKEGPNWDGLLKWSIAHSDGTHPTRNLRYASIIIIIIIIYFCLSHILGVRAEPLWNLPFFLGILLQKRLPIYILFNGEKWIFWFSLIWIGRLKLRIIWLWSGTLVLFVLWFCS